MHVRLVGSPLRNAAALLLGLIALLTMHGLTSPAGHSSQLAHQPMGSAAGWSVTSDESAGPGDVDPSHAEVGAACAAFVIVSIGQLTRVQRTWRVRRTAPHRVRRIAWRPDPPVPRPSGAA